MSKKYKICCGLGDGIGPELIEATIGVLRNLEQKTKGLCFDFRKVECGYDLWKKTGAVMNIYGRTFGGISEQVVKEAEATDAMLYVAITGEAFPRELTTPFPVFRKHFDLFANVRPSKSYPRVQSVGKDIDFVLVREQAEGLWMASEFEIGKDVACALMVATRPRTMKIARFAFSLAKQRNAKKRVTCVHKANVLRKVFGLWLDVHAQVATEYPEVKFDEMHTDVLPFQLIRQPQNFDVIVTTNMYGDAISGETAGITGGMGLLPSGEYGDSYAIFRPVHGSAPKYAGKNVVNPCATILSAAMMIEWLGSRHQDETARLAAKRLQKAVRDVLEEGNKLTYDLGGNAKTTEMADEIARMIEPF